MRFLFRLLRRRRLERDLDDELRFHVETHARDLIVGGVPPDEARRRAHAAFGGVESIKHATREVRGTRRVEDLAADVRYAARALRWQPGFALVAMLTLALGIGANTAVFGVVSNVLLRPLPYADPDSLVLVEPDPLALSPGWLTAAWRGDTSTLSALTGFNGPRQDTFQDQGTSSGIATAALAWNFNAVLGTRVVLGRDFAATDDARTEPTPALLSHAFWSARYGHDPGVIGRTLQIGTKRITIVGVLDPAFRFPTTGALPITALGRREQPDVLTLLERDGWMNVVARLAPNVSSSVAEDKLLATFKREIVRSGQFTQRMADRATLAVTPLHERLVTRVRFRLLLVMGAVALVLLVACANVTNLLVSRASTRHREFAVRRALGASQWAIVRLLLIESLVLSIGGAIGGLLLAVALNDLAWTALAGQVPFFERPALNAWGLGFIVIATLITGVICGLFSVPRAARSSLASMNDRADIGPARTALRRVLLSAEVASTLVLVVAAALLTKTLWNLTHVNTGFDARGVLTVTVSAGRTAPAGTDMRASASRYFGDLVDQLRRLPAVASVAAASSMPAGGRDFSSMGGIRIHGLPPPAGGDDPPTAVTVASPQYFSTLRIAVVAGRDFDASDRHGGDRVAIVNRAFQERFVSGKNIAGRQMDYDGHPVTIVGVVGDVPGQSFREEAEPLIVIPLSQMADGPFGWGRLTIVIRARDADPLSLAPVVRRAIWENDPAAIIEGLVTMDDRVAASLGAERYGAQLFGLFALVTMAIAGVGIFGVAQYSVVQRTREFGVRMALGATAREVFRIAVAHTFWPTAAGVLVGLIAAGLATRALTSMLFGLTALDPAIYAISAIGILGLSLAASYLPARRATRVDPMVALRED